MNSIIEPPATLADALSLAYQAEAGNRLQDRDTWRAKYHGLLLRADPADGLDLNRAGAALGYDPAEVHFHAKIVSDAKATAAEVSALQSNRDDLTRDVESLNAQREAMKLPDAEQTVRSLALGAIALTIGKSLPDPMSATVFDKARNALWYGFIHRLGWRRKSSAWFDPRSPERGSGLNDVHVVKTELLRLVQTPLGRKLSQDLTDERNSVLGSVKGGGDLPAFDPGTILNIRGLSI
jgi:hypothetical protein